MNVIEIIIPQEKNWCVIEHDTARFYTNEEINNVLNYSGAEKETIATLQDILANLPIGSSYYDSEVIFTKIR